MVPIGSFSRTVTANSESRPPGGPPYRQVPPMAPAAARRVIFLSAPRRDMLLGVIAVPCTAYAAHRHFGPCWLARAKLSRTRPQPIGSHRPFRLGFARP